METDINLKELWAGQSTQQPQMDTLFAKFDSIKRKHFIKLMIINILMISTMIGIIFIWLYFQPQLITTKIGMIITLVGMFVVLYVYNRLIPYFKKLNEHVNNHVFLEEIIQLREKQKFIQTRVLEFYFIMLTAGVCLYLYEYTSLMPFPWGIIFYLITLLWIGFNWFYLRPKIIKRERNKLETLIKKFEAIKDQY